MNKIVVVTDSTSNLPPHVARKYDIPIIPLNIHWGEETYLDGKTLSEETFYRWLEERKEFPTTSQPSAGSFIEFFRGVEESYQPDTILCLTISSDLSGTYSSAEQAKTALPEMQIEVLDSRSVSVGLGFQVLAAAKAVGAGESLEEVIQRVHQVRAKTSLVFTVGTLEYLHRGGRIGGAARLLGTALNLKPLLAIENGRVEPVEKIRGRRKSIQRILEITEERLAGRRPEMAAVLEVAAEEEAEAMAEEVRERLNPKEFFKAVVTPVVGGHAGPGTVGLGFYV